MALRLVGSRSETGTARSAPVARIRLDAFHRTGRPVLGRIDLAIHDRETVALSGPSGIGKTTLLRLLCGLETAPGARILRPERIALVFQEPTLLPWRSVLDNLMLPTGAEAAAARAMLERVGLAGRDGDFPGQLSLGQQRRLALARAFCGRPDLLLLDEPFVSLDPALAGEMMTLLETLRREAPVATLLVTHDPAEAARLADRHLGLQGAPGTLVNLNESP